LKGLIIAVTSFIAFPMENGQEYPRPLLFST
jgi:hypothetical protein